MKHGGRWRIGLSLVLLATAVRLCWTLLVPTIAVGDFATYRESGIYLAEFGHLDSGFVYMPGLVVLLAALHRLGGEVLAAKMLGVVFGGLAAAPVYVIALHALDDRIHDSSLSRRADRKGVVAGGAIDVAVTQGKRAPTGWSRDPAALIAALAYALWPAGIAMSSVVGTDIPTATLILFALSMLCAFGPRRPVLASVMFGAGMGVAAYFRSVALPLTVLAAVYWLARRQRARDIIARTAIAMAVTLLLLLPWGLRNRSKSGEFYLTDSHGGITALMGNDPNTEGTYSRSLSTTFRALTGRTFLTEPHRQTDHAAYGLAKQFMAFDVRWTAGMIALRIERLFAPERGLLYWPIYRPGVLPPERVGWFNVHRAGITGLADWFYLLFVMGLCAAVSFAVVERRWMVLVPLPFALAMTATYALFVAEPRYRVTTEVVLFPIVGFGLWRLGQSGVRDLLRLRTAIRRRWGSGRTDRFSWGNSTGPADAQMRRGLRATVVAVLALSAIGLLVVRGGKALRNRHRWAVTVWQVDGRPRMAMWRGRPSHGEPSPVWGAAPSAVLRLRPGQRDAEAEITVPGVVPASAPTSLSEGGRTRHLCAALAWTASVSPETSVSIDGARAVAGVTRLCGDNGTGDRTTPIKARIERAAGDDTLVEVAISDVVLTTGSSP